MTNTPVDPVVEMKIDGVWVDVTADVRLGNADSGGGIDIVRGVPNEGNSAEPTQLSFVLNNGVSKAPTTAGQVGVYSPTNPYSPNFGKLGRNTPVRVGINRRTDTFQRTAVDSWGKMPDRVTPELVTVSGDTWELGGPASRFDIAAPGSATISGGTGMAAATFGTYADVEIRAKVRTSVLDSEFGVVGRLQRIRVSTDPGDFENGIGTWQPFGGTSTLVASTAQFHSGTRSGLLTVAGSPAQAYARPNTTPVVPGRTYRARMWVRCSIATTITASIDWLDAGGGYISGAYNGVAVAANTWTLAEVSGAAPDAAASASHGPNTAASPPNGTLLFIDDVELQDNSELRGFTAYFMPGSPNRLSLGRLTPTGNSANVINSPFAFATNTDYWVCMQISGLRRRAKFWKDGDPEPTTWLIRTYELNAATASDYVPAYGQVGLQASGGTSVVTFSSVQVNVWRAHAEIAALPPRWDLSRQDRWVPIAASGILRRLGQGRKALESAVTLHLAEYTTSRLWLPLESVDGTSLVAGNRIPGAMSASVKGLAQGSIDATGVAIAPGLAGCAVFEDDDSYLQAQVQPGAPNGIWSLLTFLRIPQLPATEQLIYRVETSGTGRRIEITYRTTGGIRVDVLDGDGSIISTNTALMYFSGIPQGSWVAANLYLFASGGTVNWAWNFSRPGSDDFYTINGSYAGSVGGVRSVKYFSSATLVAAGSLQIAHVFHYPGDLPTVSFAFARAIYAYSGEAAITRWLRLGQNAQINVTTTGFTAQSKTMGYQTLAKTLDLFDEIAIADQSIIMEERDDFGLNMRTRESMWNQRPLMLDLDAGHISPPLEPNYDDQQTRNDVTVNRPNGSFYRSVALAGPLNVSTPEEDPINGVGVYDASPDHNLTYDTQLQPSANWLRARGTIDEPRYPSIQMDLTASAYQSDPGLTAALIARDSGDVESLLNTEVSYNRTEQILQGYTEHLDQYEWSMTHTTVPAATYRVGVVGKTTRLATRGYLTVNSSFVAGTGTRLSTARTLPGALWVQVADSPGSFPFEIEADGVRLVVEATGDVLNNNPYFDTDITGYVPTAGVTTLYRDRYNTQFKEGTASLRMTCSAGGTGGCEADPALPAVTVAGTTYQVSGWVMTSAALADVRLAVDWYQANGTTFISTGLPAANTTGVMAWKHITAQLVAPALAARARVRVRAVLTAGQIVWVDSFRLMPVPSFSASPQTLSVRQAPTNGVVKTVNAGKPISVVAPWRLAL